MAALKATMVRALKRAEVLTSDLNVDGIDEVKEPVSLQGQSQDLRDVEGFSRDVGESRHEYQQKTKGYHSTNSVFSDMETMTRKLIMFVRHYDSFIAERKPLT
jgi:hypothetical protein